MKSTSTFTLYSFAMTFLFAGLAFLTISDRDHIGIVQSKSGLVMAISGEERRPLEKKDKVYATETLATGSKSKVQIMFGDGTVLVLDENTLIELSDFAYEAMDKEQRFLDFKVLTGTCRFITGQITKHNPDDFQMDTPLGTIGIRGTEGGIIITPANAAQFFAALNSYLVKGGLMPLPESYLEMLVAHINGLTSRQMIFTPPTGPGVEIPRGFVLFVSGNGTPGTLEPFDPEQKERFKGSSFQKQAHIPPAFSPFFSGYQAGPQSVGTTGRGGNAGDGAQQESQDGGDNGGGGHVGGHAEAER